MPAITEYLPDVKICDGGNNGESSLRFITTIPHRHRGILSEESEETKSNSTQADEGSSSGTSKSRFRWGDTCWRRTGAVASRSGSEGEVGTSQAGGVPGMDIDRAVAEEGANTALGGSIEVKVAKGNKSAGDKKAFAQYYLRSLEWSGCDVAVLA